MTITAKFEKKMEELDCEIQELSNLREQLIEKIKEIEVRITQLIGAMTEIKVVLDEVEAESVAAIVKE